MTEEQAACIQIRVGLRALQHLRDEAEDNSIGKELTYSFDRARGALMAIEDEIGQYESYMGVSHD